MQVDHKPVVVEIVEDSRIFFYAFEMWIGMNEFDPGILALFKKQRERAENSGLNGDSNPDLYDAGALLKCND